MAHPASHAPLLNRFKGCLVGLGVGDALGAPVEGMAASEIALRYGRLTEMVGGGWLGLAPGEYTDDAAMMLCLARSIVQRGGFDPADVAGHFLRWFESGPVGIGRTTWMALSELARGVGWPQASAIAHDKLGGYSAGNGSIMRCAPIALLHFRRPDRLIEDSQRSSLITHWDPRAGWGAAALNLSLARLLEKGRAGLLPRVASATEEAEVKQAVLAVAGMPATALRPSGFVLDTLQCALWCFLNTASFEEAVVTAVNLGGDADTIGAVTGALAGAGYGLEAIPLRWRDRLQDREEMETLAEKLYALA